MATLGAYKATMLNQLKNKPDVSVEQLKKLVDQYDDVQIDDFRGIVSGEMLRELTDLCRDPNEYRLWSEIESTPRTDPGIIQDIQRKVNAYIQQYPGGPKINEANELAVSLTQEMNRAIEEQRRREEEERRAREAAEMAQREANDWNMLDRSSYESLMSYRLKYPSSAHLDELDDMMWNFTRNELSRRSLNRYLNDWPMGRHVSEANASLADADDWEKVAFSGDLLAINNYRYNHPGSRFNDEANKVFDQLRSQEVYRMKENPTAYSKDRVIDLIDAGIFTKNELFREGLMNEESWRAMNFDRNSLPRMQDFKTDAMGVSAEDDCTDIYLFGTPGTGKTCLLMGLAQANGTKDDKGQKYTLNMKVNGGAYASALQQYVRAGVTPGRTSGSYISTIHGNVTEIVNNKIIDHKINFVEMSGEEFAERISDNLEVSFENMGTGATRLLSNTNRKVFFIIVDCGDELVKLDRVRYIYNSAGEKVGEESYKKTISQLDILNKFVGLFDRPENREIMSRVDAIHFIVTKSDRLGNKSTRLEKAKELLMTTYKGPVENLKDYSRQSKRINYSTDYAPRVFTFSLGDFYVGDVFCFDDTETMQIVDAIRTVTGGTREKTWWDIFKEKIG